MHNQSKGQFTRSLFNLNVAALLIGCSAFAQAKAPQTYTYSNQFAGNNQWVQYGSFPVHGGSTLKAVMSPIASDPDSDPDLYVQWGAEPAYNSFVCRPSTEFVDEVCELTVPVGVTEAFVGVKGWAFNSDFDLTVTHQAPDTDYWAGDVGNTEWARHAPYSVTPGRVFKVVMTPNDNGYPDSDADLYVQFGSDPWFGNHSCWASTQSEERVCEIVVPEGETQAYVAVLGYGFHASYEVKVTYQ
ncbi:hypothetical protein [Aliikangiella coralliicola]|uniref:Uncharacterized protein n=1 Tax=Aliikangiella coralliicola TaxID=2592383 RepID=A0A545U6F2_9GAMM|nr:hypothetical protein [Aliikangiella coralliicola]TQV85055.1 hypothetical protein FLL46_21955 [Aliikangiella coralliicola]